MELMQMPAKKRGAGRPARPGRNRPVSFYAGEDYSDALDYASKYKRMTKTEIVRVALEKYLADLNLWPWPPKELPSLDTEARG
jgi:hypothetical protein